MIVLTDLWKTISENAVWSTIVGGIILTSVFWAIKSIVTKLKANRLYKILGKELKARNKTFLTTTLLSSKSGFTESEVERLCIYHDKIHRNEKEKQSWRIED